MSVETLLPLDDSEPTMIDIGAVRRLPVLERCSLPLHAITSRLKGINVVAAPQGLMIADIFDVLYAVYGGRINVADSGRCCSCSSTVVKTMLLLAAPVHNVCQNIVVSCVC
jgi:hypothetical protein